jgi:CRP-like cAMP-binding protein
MNIDDQIYNQCALFSGISKSDFAKMLTCFAAQRRRVQKDSFVALAGDPISSFGVVLTGSLYIIDNDFWGRRNILEKITAGGLYAASYILEGATYIPVSIQAAEDSVLLQIPGKKFPAVCKSACSCHSRMITNLLTLLSRNAVSLVAKINCLSKRTTREKLLSWLSSQAFSAGSSSFTISFNRQELADYLAVDRSALSAELSRMRKDGLIEYDRNHFTLKESY